MPGFDTGGFNQLSIYYVFLVMIGLILLNRIESVWVRNTGNSSKDLRIPIWIDLRKFGLLRQSTSVLSNTGVLRVSWLIICARVVHG